MKHKIPFLLLLLTLGASFGVASNAIYYNDFEVAKASVYDPESGAQYYADPNLYYQGIDPSLTGEDLMRALAKLTRHQEGIDYSDLDSVYADAFLNDNGNELLCYTHTERKGTVNKEHVWAASWYGHNNGTHKDYRETGKGSPGADAHNVWPCAEKLNSKRGSACFDYLVNEPGCFKNGEFSENDFDYVEKPNDPEYYFWSSQSGKSNCNGAAGDAVCPPKGHRGEIARCMLYVATSYRFTKPYTPTLVDRRIAVKKTGEVGKLSTLLKWHFEELPSDWEIKQNQLVAQNHHHNRNPFIDHPEYASLIYAYLPEPGSNKPTDAVLDVINTYGNLNFADPTGIEVTDTNLTVSENGTVKIKAKALPEDAKQQFIYESLDNNIAKVDNSGVVTGVKAGTCKIKVKLRENTSIYTFVNVTVKKVTSIEITGTINKKDYFAFEKINPAGLKVTAKFNDGTSEIINNSDCKWLDGVTRKENLSEGTTLIICQYGNLEATYSGISVTKKAHSGYYKVESPLADYTGNYMIVCESSNVMLDGGASNYTNTNGNIQLECTYDGLNCIKGDYEDHDWSITKSGDKYKITSSSGKTVGGHSKKDFEVGDFTHSISISDGDADLKCGSYYLRYNHDTGDFRYYAKTSCNPIALYKSDAPLEVIPDENGDETETLPDVPTNTSKSEAELYASKFLAANICGTDDNTKAKSDIFLAQKDEYLMLNDGAKELLRLGKANKDGTTNIERCLAKYDRIIFLHSDESDLYPDFMGRKNTAQFNPNIEPISEAEALNPTIVAIIGVALSISIVTAAGTTLYVCLRKKHKN